MARTFPGRSADIAPPRPIVSFTFDDVPESALVNGARILEQYAVRGTFYVAGGIAGALHDGQQMTDDTGYRRLAARGHEIGHHTFSHRTPTALGRLYGRDLDRNDAYLSTIIDGYARNFAFPYGRSSLSARRLVGHRFRSGRGVETGINRDRADLDLLRAVEMQGHSTAEQMVGWVDQVVDNVGWLIFLTHDVRDDASVHGVRPDLLEATVAYAIAKGCEVLTVDAALDLMEIEQ
jgi:peptidoglycan/xylan/chitin deacetylase (PgdA/CDA1 family)